MNAVHFLRDNNGGVTVPCPVGKRVRVLSFMAAIANASVDEVFVVQFFQSNDFIAEVSSPPTSVVVGRVCAGIGATAAGGAVACFGLLDIWWDFEVIVRGSGDTSATILATVVSYELRDA